MWKLGNAQSSLHLYPCPTECPDEAGANNRVADDLQTWEICLIAFEDFSPVKWLVFPQVQQ